MRYGAVDCVAAGEAPVRDDLVNGPLPAADGWSGLYAVVDAVAPRHTKRREALCAYFRPKPIELASGSLLYRALGVRRFGRFIPTGGIDIRRLTKARMRAYTLHEVSLRGARDFYFRACVFEALHLPFFLLLLGLALQRLSIGRIDFAIQETVINGVVNLYPILHHRHTRARIARLLAGAHNAGVRRVAE